MQTHMSVDIETFSSADIRKAGLYAYAHAPDFDIMLFAWSLDGQPSEIIDLTSDPDEARIAFVRAALRDPNVVKHAYNAAFELYCLNLWGWDTPAEQWRDTQAHGLYCGLPAGLAAAAESLGLPQDEKKMGAGTALIRTFCIPRKPTKNDARPRVLPHHEPEKWALFKDYCKQDVVAEMAVDKALSAWPFPAEEEKLWQLDLRIAVGGVRIDRALVDGAILCGAQIAQEQQDEFAALTGGVNPKSTPQLTTWLEEATGAAVDNLQKATVSAMLEETQDATVRRALQLRQELSRTSTKKYDAMARMACPDGRARGMLRYYGANRTGRWTGSGIQLHNLPRNYMDTLDIARGFVREGNLPALRVLYANIPDTLSQLVRTAFVPSQGNTFIVGDFAAIEARVIAWWAQETWRQQVFSTHGKIYEASAAQMFGVPLEKIVKGNPEYELRQRGKVAELALGFGGGVGALVAMGGEKMGLSATEMEEIKRRWRLASPRIVDLWHAMEAAALDVMRTGRTASVNGVILSRENAAQIDYLTIQLPSGRKLFYARPCLRLDKWGKDALHYWGVDQTTKRWGLQSTWAGKIVENCVQGIARDCLAFALVNLDAAGYNIAMHVHDEAVIDAPPDARLDDVLKIMRAGPPWAAGLLLDAAGFECAYYQKD